MARTYKADRFKEGKVQLHIHLTRGIPEERQLLDFLATLPSGRVSATISDMLTVGYYHLYGKKRRGNSAPQARSEVLHVIEEMNKSIQVVQSTEVQSVEVKPQIEAIEQSDNEFLPVGIPAHLQQTKNEEKQEQGQTGNKEQKPNISVKNML